MRLRSVRSRLALATSDTVSGSRPAAAAAGNRTLGAIDRPRDGAIGSETALVVDGWCLFEGSQVDRVEVLVDGEVTAVARAGVRRDDVVAAVSRDPEARTAGYQAVLELSPRAPGSETVVSVEAMSADGRRWRSEVRTVRWARWVDGEQADLALGFGVIDSPKDGAQLEPGALEVHGWCLLEGTRVARVAVIVDGELRDYARSHVDRLDLSTHSFHPEAPVSGFWAMLDLERQPLRAESLVCIEAVGLDGRRWRSPTHLVRWKHPERLDGGSFDTPLVTRCRAQIDRRSTRVLVFTHALTLGGGQLWLLELLRQAQEVSDLDFSVVSETDGPLRGRLESMGIEVHVTTMPATHDAQLYESRCEELALLIAGNDAGVVFVNTLGIFGAVDAASRSGVPCVWAIHESFPPAVFRRVAWGAERVHPHVRDRFEHAFASARALVFEARQTADLFAHLSAPEQCFVVDYGVDMQAVERFRATARRDELRAAAGIPEGSTVVLMLGTVEARKGQAAAVAAFDELARVHGHLRLILVGDAPGRYTDAVRQQIERSEAADRIQLVPVTPDIFPWLLIADLFLCASDIESLPRSILDAMTFELPVLSTDAFGIAGLIEDGVTGWLTRPRDLEALIGLLHYVLRLSEAERRAVGARGLADVIRRHDADPYGHLFARAFRALIDDPASDLVPLLSSNLERTG